MHHAESVVDVSVYMAYHFVTLHCLINEGLILRKTSSPSLSSYWFLVVLYLGVDPWEVPSFLIRMSKILRLSFCSIVLGYSYL